jgi:hypothetical protein
MMTLLASIAGFITSIIPEFVRLKKEKHDKEHELKIIDRQIEYSKLCQGNDISTLGIKRDLSEISALYSTYKTGINWVDTFNGTVRPMITYCFFGFYVYIKSIQYKYMVNMDIVLENVELIWNSDDQTIFAGIISFYFGQRAFNKLSQRK